MKKITLKTVSECLSNMEMKNVTGGAAAVSTGGGEGYHRCCPTKPSLGECVFDAGCKTDAQCVGWYGDNWVCKAY